MPNLSKIDSFEALPKNLSYKMLECHCYTGQAVLISGTGRHKKYEYRTGMLTDIGDIAYPVWARAVNQLIDDSGERDLYDALMEWEKQRIFFLHTKAEWERYVLDHFAQRIFDNPGWCDYEAFNREHQPEIFKDPTSKGKT